MNGPAVCCPACGHALFTVDEPAWPVLAISRSSLYQLMSAGAVQTVRLARTVRIPRREVERLEDGAGHETRRCSPADSRSTDWEPNIRLGPEETASIEASGWLILAATR